MLKTLPTLLLLALMIVANNINAQTTETFDFTANTYGMTVLSGQTSAYNPDPYTMQEGQVTVTLTGRTRCWQESAGTDLRLYSGSAIGINVPTDSKITSVKLTIAKSGGYSSYYSFSEGTLTWASTVGTLEPNAEMAALTINMTNDKGNSKLEKIEVTYAPSGTVAAPTISGTDQFIGQTTITILASGATIYYTTDGSDPTTSSQVYNGPFDITATTTVKAIAVVGGKSSSVAASTFNLYVMPTYTVAEALAVLDGADIPTNEVRVTGIVSRIDSISSKFKSAYYYISDDGTAANELYVYSGKGLNKADFTDLSQLSVGDKVTVQGVIKVFKNLKEFNYGSHIVEQVATGIHTVKAKVSANGRTYNLAGQEVGKDYKGIVIQDGKKVLRK